MFKRRAPIGLLKHTRESVWPSMGWKRAVRYTYLRVMRASDDTHKIAGGLAIGTAVAFTPILGTHFIQAALLAWIFRCNIVAAIATTWLANPWTIPFIWWGSIVIGAWVFSFLGIQTETAFTQHMDFPLFWHLLTHQPVSVLLPWLTGGYLLALAICLPAYFSFYYLVRSAKTARVNARKHAMHKVAMEVTGQDA